MTKWISYDIEIAMQIPEGVEDWSTLHPMGITCAATCSNDGKFTRVFHGVNEDRTIADRMSPLELAALVGHLHSALVDGYQIVGLNTAGFDFQELAASSGHYEICKWLVWQHYDIFFAIFCQLGYAPGLNAISLGMGCGSKTDGVDGAKAPELWANGEYDTVLGYVANDARLTLDVALAVEAAGEVRWTSKTGRPQIVNMDRWLTVKEANELPVVDNRWMKGKAWTREKFIGWLL